MCENNHHTQPACALPRRRTRVKALACACARTRAETRTHVDPEHPTRRARTTAQNRKKQIYLPTHTLVWRARAQSAANRMRPRAHAILRQARGDTQIAAHTPAQQPPTSARQSTTAPSNASLGSLSYVPVTCRVRAMGGGGAAIAVSSHSSDMTEVSCEHVISDTQCLSLSINIETRHGTDKCNGHIVLYETRQRNEPLRIDYLIQSSPSGRQTGVQNCLTNSKEVHKPAADLLTAVKTSHRIRRSLRQ
jgi:hypothetical protein